MNQPRQLFFIFLRGIVMGAADAVPGVSGGTIALITGIYARLIEAIRSFDVKAIQLFFTGKWADFWKKIDGTFLICLLSGIGTSLIVLSRIILYLLDIYPEILWAFFFGLIVASAWVIGKDIKRWSIILIIGLVIGVIAGYAITELAPAETPETLPYVFASGAIAICAMILPGISGSFILVILGKYDFILTALKEFNLWIIVTFSAGCLIGLLAFSHVIHWLLRKYQVLTMAFLTGIMIGSLNKVWPWKHAITTYTDRHGEIKPLTQENLFPQSYETITGNESHLIFAVLFAIVGFVLVYGINYLGKSAQPKE
jgi:putative membrane protein